MITRKKIDNSNNDDIEQQQSSLFSFLNYILTDIVINLLPGLLIVFIREFF